MAQETEGWVIRRMMEIISTVHKITSFYTVGLREEETRN